MLSIKKLFARNTVKEPPAVVSGIDRSFRALQDEILRIGKAQGRNRTKDSVSLNNKNVDSTAGTKEWVLVQRDALYIRYYDRIQGGAESLYVLSLDRTQEKFTLQRRYDFDSAEEAVAVFLNLLEDYADPAFMRALKDSLVEKSIIQYLADDDVAEAAGIALEGRCPKKLRAEPPIK
jgi:hypothetical protein